MNPPNPFHPKKCWSFADSGAHSLTNKIFKNKKGVTSGKVDWSLYDTPEFWAYVDHYAKFIKEYKDSFDWYCNVDVIRNPKRSWKVQKYLEDEHGLKPIPVVHFNTPLHWITKYIDSGYDYIGMGGPVGKIPYDPWADRAWDLICSTPTRIPAVRIHGFAVTTHRYITRYPWYSVDSVTWKKMSYFGQILVPPKLGSHFNFSVPNLIVFIDGISPYSNRGNGKGRHFLHYSNMEKRAILDWLEFINVPYGKSKGKEIIEIGVSNDIQTRCKATILYFEHLVASLPKWPWAFRRNPKPTLTDLFL